MRLKDNDGYNHWTEATSLSFLVHRSSAPHAQAYSDYLLAPRKRCAPMHKLVWAYGVIRPTSSPKLGIAASAAASLLWWRSVKGHDRPGWRLMGLAVIASPLSLYLPV